MIIKIILKHTFRVNLKLILKNKERIYKMINNVLTQKLQFINVIIRLKTCIFYNIFLS